MAFPFVNYTIPISVQPGAPTANPDPQTLLQVEAAANHRIIILGLEIGLGGSDPATQPLRFDWVVQTSEGTNSTDESSVVAKQDRGYSEAIQGSYRSFNAATATEPTDGGASAIIPASFSLHRLGTLPWVPKKSLIINGSEKLGFRQHGVDATQGNNVNVYFTIYCSQ